MDSKNSLCVQYAATSNGQGVQLSKRQVGTKPCNNVTPSGSLNVTFSISDDTAKVKAANITKPLPIPAPLPSEWIAMNNLHEPTIRKFEQQFRSICEKVNRNIRS